MSWAIWDIYSKSVDKTTLESIFSWKKIILFAFGEHPTYGPYFMTFKLKNQNDKPKYKHRKGPNPYDSEIRSYQKILLNCTNEFKKFNGPQKYIRGEVFQRKLVLIMGTHIPIVSQFWFSLNLIWPISTSFRRKCFYDSDVFLETIEFFEFVRTS